MGKRLLSLYVNDELIELAKSRRMNMSRLFTEIITSEINDKKDNKTQEEQILELKLKNAVIMEENTKLKEFKLKQEKINERRFVRVG